LGSLNLIDTSGIPTSLHPRLKLFLSADIVGSTALKQPFDLSIVSLDHDKWQQVIQGFYKQIDEKFKNAWTSASISLQKDIKERFFGESPRFWKTIGDEIVYWKCLSSDEQLRVTLRCWMDVIPKVRSWLKLWDPALDIKCTAWLAEFPVRNKAVWSENDFFPTDRHAEGIELNSLEKVAELSPPTENKILLKLNDFYERRLSDGSIDFIGPGIDVGFRISQWSSSIRFVIDVDIAYLMSLTESSWRASRVEQLLPQDWLPRRNGNFVDIYFGGSHYLKGVLGGSDYPRFWINLSDERSLYATHNALSSQPEKPSDFNRLQNFCMKYYEERSKYIFEPFINSAFSQSSEKISNSYELLLTDIVKRYLAY